jgi:hypothetical protein
VLYDFIPTKTARTIELLADATAIAIYLQYLGAFSQIYAGFAGGIGAISAKDGLRGTRGRGIAYASIFAAAPGLADLGMNR